MPAEALWRSAIGKMVLTGGAVAERHQEAAAGRGAAEQDAAGREEQGCIGKQQPAEKTQGCIGKLLLAGDA